MVVFAPIAAVRVAMAMAGEYWRFAQHAESQPQVALRIFDNRDLGQHLGTFPSSAPSRRNLDVLYKMRPTGATPFRRYFASLRAQDEIQVLRSFRVPRRRVRNIPAARRINSRMLCHIYLFLTRLP